MPVCSRACEERKEKILLVDDELDIARLFTLVLQNRGFDVNTFNDPLQALSNFRPFISSGSPGYRIAKYERV
jgi:PleD family two-component response regulator